MFYRTATCQQSNAVDEDNVDIITPNFKKFCSLMKIYLNEGVAAYLRSK